MSLRLRATRRALRLPIVALAIVTAAALGLSGCTSSSSPSSSSTALPTGTKGAVHFSKGYIQVGSGPVVLDEYTDPMCPYCGQFEKTNSATIAAAVKAKKITVRIHPMNFLDQSSQGTQYSSRAVSALVCVATTQPASTLPYFSALYRDQPRENSPGLTNAQLGQLSRSNGGPSIGGCIGSAAYKKWSSWLTSKAIAGPLPGTQLPKIQGTPTILAGGKQYTGSLTDSAAFISFLSSSLTSN